jgi:hypothetical protein
MDMKLLTKVYIFFLKKMCHHDDFRVVYNF